ncbi:hypothetical protein [Salinimicrobium flavum]|uniref:DUF3575 domain-containing protein n=1 Tax=Salinimicrobium flavum TaxID=1737065 RepID=A0ABW5J0G1_9FLAO
MKYLSFTTLLILLLIFPNKSKAQVQEPEVGIHSRDVAKHELSLNVLNVLIFGALDASYEYVLNDHSTIGIDVFSKVFNKNEDDDVDLSEVYAKDFSVTTGFKYFYKEENSAWGFYAEGFGMLSDGVNEKEVEKVDGTGGTIYLDEELEYTDFALGFGIGGKFVAKQGFLIDVSFGLGRNLFHKDSPDIVILPAVNVGYRF